MNKNSRLVYSTSSQASVASKKVRKQNETVSSSRETDGILRIHRQTKGRKGKGVSIITGFAVDEENLKKLAKQLKQKLGVGGSVKQGNIEMQTSEREQIKQHLQLQGYQVRVAGG